MKPVLFAIFSILTVSTLFAQDTSGTKYGWQKQAVAGFNLSNAYYHKWAAGGENALTWNLKLKGKLVEEREKTTWKNTGKMEYGQTKVTGSGFRKSLDEIFFESVYGYKLTTLLNPYASASLQSQFAKGYDYEQSPDAIVSAFWNPGYITQSVGMGFKPLTDLIVRLGFSLKETFAGKYGDYADNLDTDKKETVKVEPGLELITDYEYKLSDIAMYVTKWNLFINFEGMDEIDSRWENRINAQISKYINVNAGLELFYDVSTGERSTQWKQDVALGMNFNLL
ncbi:MAG: DUF3078 domain-containing protein [Fibrobacteria bacterium]|nr:DUF3078 domain-containing protein [Fibrobacteria bacterium]